MNLKPRQRAAFVAIFAALRSGQRRQLVCLPTGVGKTVLAAHVAREFSRTLFLVHREELLRQTRATMTAVSPDGEQGVIGPDAHAVAPFTVGMVQTVYRRLGRLDPSAFDLVIVDEAHHAAAKTWRSVTDHFRPRLRLGLSATPERLDGAPLSDLFDSIVYQMTIKEAVSEGYLTAPRCVQVHTRASLAGVRKTAGDFSEGDLQKALDNPTRNALVARKYREHAEGRKALLFAAGVDHAIHLAEAFEAEGVRAAAVWGDDPDRAEKVAALASGRLDVLSNAQVLTEGFDDPGLGAILLARPTQSRVLFAQMVGRGLRLHPGKATCLLLDFADVAGKHPLLTAWQFFGRPGEPGDGIERDPLTPTSREERARAAQAKAGRLFGGSIELRAVDRLLNILRAPPEVSSFEIGSAWWHHEPASEKQMAMLAGYGYDVAGNDWTKGQAAAVIGQLPASENQIRLLLAMGFDVLTTDWTREQASRALDGAKRRAPDWALLAQVSPQRRAWA